MGAIEKASPRGRQQRCTFSAGVSPSTFSSVQFSSVQFSSVQGFIGYYFLSSIIIFKVQGFNQLNLAPLASQISCTFSTTFLK